MIEMSTIGLISTAQVAALFVYFMVRVVGTLIGRKW